MKKQKKKTKAKSKHEKNNKTNKEKAKSQIFYSGKKRTWAKLMIDLHNVFI